MLRSIGLCIGLFLSCLLSSHVYAAVINQENYTIYYGDLNADGASDYYFARKPLMLVLHGDIAITFPIKLNEHFALYRNGDAYTGAQAFALTDAEVAQRVSAGTLRLAVLNNDFFLWERNGENYAFLRGADASAPAVLLKSLASTVLPTAVNYSVATYPEISNRNYPLAITDINNDGYMDIVLGSGDINSSQEQTAYLANASGIPNTYFEVTPAAIEPSLPIDQGSGIKYHVGTVGGQFRVDESGAATYNIPIQLPEGVAGVTPQVALNYSSQAGVGLLGKGWSLSAYSGISRCRKTLSQDNDVKPITWTSQDRFCLDGQRLIVVSGTYGAVNSQYKTEIDSFTRITALGGTAGHPSYFKVEGKDGSVSYYGRTNNAKIYGSGSAIATTTLTWALSRFEDNVGNGIDYFYENDSDTPATGDFGHRLKQITYAYPATSKNPSTIPQSSEHNAKVEFFYEAGTNSSAYVAGYEFKNTQRLSRIEVSNKGQEVRRYVLSYMATNTATQRYANNISRLEMVRECKGASDCFAPHIFSWGGGSDIAYDLIQEKIDFPITATDRYLLNYSFADATGDGKQDFFSLMYDESKATSSSPNKAVVSVYVKYSGENLISSLSVGTVNDYRDIRINNLDYNADGRQDLAVFNGTNWVIYLSTLNTQNKWRIDSQSNFIPLTASTFPKDTIFADMDSNGLADAVNKNGYYPLVRNSELSTSNKAYSFGSIKNFSIHSPGSYTISGPMTPAMVTGCTLNGSVSGEILPEKMGDFNGDGEMDFVAKFTQAYNCTSVNANGTTGGQVAATRTSHYVVAFGDDLFKNYSQSTVDWFVDGQLTETQFADLNSDGLTDIIYISKKKDYSYRLNNGNGFNAIVSWVSLSSDKIKPQFMDYNSDGAVDFIWHNPTTSKMMVRFWGESADNEIMPQALGMEKDTHLIMDVSGDGIFDYIKAAAGGLSGYNGSMVSAQSIPCHNVPVPMGNGYWCVGGVPGTSIPADRQHSAIYEIHNGLGAVTKINYGTLANSGHYVTIDVNPTLVPTQSPGNCPNGISSNLCPPTNIAYVANAGAFYRYLNEGWPLIAGNTTLDGTASAKNHPVLEVNGAMQIVTSVESSAPVASNPNARSKISYFYEEGKMQARGRGFLGFRRLKTVDEQTEVMTVTTYRQDYPFVGNPMATLVYKKNASDALVLSSAINTWNVVATPGSDLASNYYQVSLTGTEEKSFDYSDGALLQTVTSNSVYEEGNLKDSTVVTSGKKADGSVTSLTKVTKNTYGTTAEEKRLGRLSLVVVKTTRDTEPEETRQSEFAYYGAGDPKGAQYLLKSEHVINANIATPTTVYEYDGYGNKVKVTTEASATDKRSVIYTYDENGRYLVSTRNTIINDVANGEDDIDLISTIHPRDIFGNINSVTDINGINSKIYHDAMGNEYMRKDVTGAWTRTDSQYCTNSISCPTGASYRVYKRVAGGGKAYEYYDMLGRVIRSTKIDFGGTPTHVDTEYDNLSRTKRQSLPFTGAAAQYWTENTYDNLSRVTEVKAPDGSKSTSTYTGNITLVTNALSQTRTEYRNGLGQLVKVKDHLNGTIEYDYDLNGNLTNAKTTADSASVNVRICYDSLGRKVAMHDPDKGGFLGNSNALCSEVANPSNPKKTGWWYYSYNTYGELVEQTDPKGQKTRNYYDEMGRMVGRIDYLSSGAIEGLTQWFYEGGVGAHNPEIKGTLTAVVMNTASGFNTNQAENFIATKTASCTETSSSCFKTLHQFDGLLKLPKGATVYYPGSSQAYDTYIHYDYFGRVSRQMDALNEVITDATGKKLASGIQTHYNSNGYAYKTTDVATGLTLQATEAVNVLGQVTQEYRGNGVTTYNTYDILTGLMTQQKSGIGGVFGVQNISYKWDLVGNLEYRHNQSALKTGGTKNLKETFEYDGLNRLVNTLTNYTKPTAPATCTNAQNQVKDIVYYGNGNIKCKREVGEYTYGSNAGPHAVTSAGGNTYTYDNNGNMLSGDSRSFEYTSYDMAKKITKGSNSTEFKYGPDRGRWQRIDKKGSTTTTTTYLGNVERIEVAGSPVIEWKRYINGVIYTYSTNNYALQNSSRSFVYNDHLGSVDVITNETGSIKQSLSFDPWGARRNGENWASSFSIGELTLSGFTQPVTTRGYTGHEMVDDMGIIHMNGRIYDAKLGRFLQADPFIDGAGNTQGYNRYSYVKNNPLNATDPSGFFLSDLKKGWNKIRPFVGAIVAIVATYYCGPTCGMEAAALIGAAAGAAQAAANGGNIQAVLRGALTGAVSAAAFYSVGQMFSQGGAISFGSASVGRQLGWAATQGMVGGVLAVLNGGKFGHGFASAFVTKYANVNDIVGTAANKATERVLLAAIIGGTVSEMTGGKFANGAITAAMMQAVNGETEAAAEEDRKWLEHFARVESLLNDFTDSADSAVYTWIEWDIPYVSPFMGAVATLATEENILKTAVTLGSAGLGTLSYFGRIAYYRYIGPNSNPFSRWVIASRNSQQPYSTMAEAKDLLQLPHMPTSYQMVKVPFWKPVVGPRTVSGNPLWGNGGGKEWYVGWKFPN